MNFIKIIIRKMLSMFMCTDRYDISNDIIVFTGTQDGKYTFKFKKKYAFIADFINHKLKNSNMRAEINRTYQEISHGYHYNGPEKITKKYGNIVVKYYYGTSNIYIGQLCIDYLPEELIEKISMFNKEFVLNNISIDDVNMFIKYLTDILSAAKMIKRNIDVITTSTII